MKYFLTTIIILSMFGCSSKTIYIVRHAEKATQGPNMTSDVPLSEQGTQRAEKLKMELQQKNIGFIFSTQTIRTTTTAKPLSDAIGVPVQFYNHRDTLDKFIARVNESGKMNVLIVGHSNTVDDLVNKFIGDNTLTDLPDSVYNRLFIVKRKGKNGYSLVQKTFEP
ncbi:MAG TPA: phosphoglycerate mutase family protein [Lacibacter sp.]|nr:phosphoglycerate mutase family protein [Lacibacter sp.]